MEKQGDKQKCTTAQHAVIKHAGFSGFSSVSSRLVGLSRGIQTQPRNPARFIPQNVGGNLKKQLTTKNIQENEAISNCKIE